ncbi:hypothetical protein [Clostridium omnivorum]|uniref:Uncharacterized protein n=1 Tax=Clostridium omnivorum TaxID=1604902 RepID=A0ABQ5N7Q0_9CLOT|nr:hypothetical protein [Clostridium sp. E14]GLC31161.1 hypothetical protein bsdE14_25710 [Clostridium sp. E14]
MKGNFYKVLLRYGHLGTGKDIIVARYLDCENTMKITDVFNLVAGMPGVKSNGVLEVAPISYEKYRRGKAEEKENFYLKKLMTFNPITTTIYN